MNQAAAPEAPAPESNPTNAVRASRRRTFLKWFGVALAVLLVAAVSGLMSVDYLGRMAIETDGTRALGVATTLDDLSIGLFSGNSSLSGLQVANPAGFESSYFLQLDSGSLDMSLRNVLNETIEIEQLSLSGIRLNLVREDEEANYRAILETIRSIEDEIADQAGADSGSQKKFLIHSVIIRDVRVNVDLLPMGGELTQLEVPIDLLELHDVGAESSRGENLAQVIGTVVRALLEAVLVKGDTILPADTREELHHVLSEMQPVETLRTMRSSLHERREMHREERREERGQRAETRRRALGPLRQRRLEER